MATWIVGDVHGCFRTFLALLRRCRYRESLDRLLLVGDLVNGGPGSLAMLRWCFERADSVESVLGNHDLYLLGRWSGVCSRKKRDTLEPLLAAADVDSLLEWLRCRPLTLTQSDFRIVHAGLLPGWDWPGTSRLAGEIESLLRGQGIRHFLRDYFEKADSRAAKGNPRTRAQLAGLRVLTMVRTCSASGALCEEFKGPPDEAPEGFRPWYEFPQNWRGTPLYFGHWAACGYRRFEQAICLDSGCVWGNSLTACRLEDGAVIQQENLEVWGNPANF